MKRILGSLAATLLALVTGLSRAEAQASTQSVSVRTGKPVYTTTGSDLVTITLTNWSATPITLSSPGPWTIWRDGTLVYAPINLAVLATLGAGQSKSWTWDKKSMGGNSVAPGSYKVEVGPLWFGVGSSLKVSHHFALTASGKVAGSSRFPLTVGNGWTYKSAVAIGNPTGLLSLMKVTQQLGTWTWLSNFVGGSRWAHLSGSSQPTLMVKSTPSAFTSPLFRFNRSVGYSYTVNVAPFLKGAKLKVGAVNTTVETPAGTFTGCYRLDVAVPPAGLADAGYTSFWFAPGIGLVQYGEIWIGGVRTYRLYQATIRGSDGKWYTIGK